MEKLLTVAEAAELLAISDKHFRREFINTGLIDVISLGKGTKGDRIAPADLKRLVEQRKRSRQLSLEPHPMPMLISKKSSLDLLGLPDPRRLKVNRKKT